MRRVAVLALLIAAAPTLSLGAEEKTPADALSTCLGKDGPTEGVEGLKLTQGLGQAKWPIRSDSAEAKAWFNYGLQLAHAFNHEEATEAFRRAYKADPTCAMCAWGEAWSRGPTINYDVEPEKLKEAAEIADKAAVLAEGGPEKERLMIQALQARYRAGSKTQAKDFAMAMVALADRYPDDVELNVIAADATLIAASASQDMKSVRRAVDLLERAVANDPQDVGAIHFLIHATEFIGESHRAEKYADTLGRLAPSSGHLVHMPSHTYFRIGRYEDAARVNLEAIEADHAWRKGLGLSGDRWRNSYHAHNSRFGIAGALMAGDERTAILLANHHLPVIDQLKPEESWYMLSASGSYVVYGRFGDPAVMLGLKDPGVGRPIARSLWRYGRGEALARKGDIAAVRAEAQAMWDERRTLGRDADFAAVGEIGRLVLLGRAAMLEGKPDKARGFYEKAARIQDKRFGGFGDPPIWWYPVRRSLAAAYLQMGRWKQAEREAEASLKLWPHDPMALMVLGQAEARLGKPAEADDHLGEARKSWKGKFDGFPLSLV